MTKEQIARYFAAKAVYENPEPEMDLDIARATYDRVMAAIGSLRTFPTCP